MNRNQRTASVLFASGMIGLGILGLFYGDFALQWQPVPRSVPWREGLAYASALLMLAGGIGLLFRRTAATSARVLFPYLLIWLLLKVPALIVAPGIEGVWLGFGETTVLLTGGWVLFATLPTLSQQAKLRFYSGDSGVRIAQFVFGAALLPIGLSHFIYVHETVALIPAWIPFPTGWAYLTGAGHIAAGLGVLFSIFPRLAATMEAAMLSVITLLVWVPVVVAKPMVRLSWTALLISWAITSAIWVVAASFTRMDSPERETAADPYFRQAR